MRITMLALLLAILALPGCADSTVPAAPAAKKPEPAAAMPPPPLQTSALAQPASAAVTISIDNFTFSPQSLTIARGATVTWINHDDIPHTVKSTDKLFKSGTLDTDDKFSFTFNDPGTFKYFCTIHAHMTGTIVVNP